jgi:hypothetical protein
VDDPARRLGFWRMLVFFVVFVFVPIAFFLFVHNAFSCVPGVGVFPGAFHKMWVSNSSLHASPNRIELSCKRK